VSVGWILADVEDVASEVDESVNELGDEVVVDLLLDTVEK